MKVIVITHYSRYIKAAEKDQSVKEHDINAYDGYNESIKLYDRKLENWLLENDIRFLVQTQS